MSVEVLDRNKAEREFERLRASLRDRLGTDDLDELREMGNYGELDDRAAAEVERLRTLAFLLKR